MPARSPRHRPSPRSDRTPDPLRELVGEVERRLTPLGTAARAQGERAYLKSDLAFLGVPLPILRRFAATLLRERPDLAGPPLREAATALWSRGVHELRTVAIELLAARARELGQEDLPLLERLLRESRSWAYVDAISIRLVGPIAERGADLAEVGRTLDRWAVDPDFWLRRAALLALLTPLRRGAGDWSRFVRYADAQLDEREFFLRKAIGWVLREVGKKRPERVLDFLAPRLARTSPLTLREALKHLPKIGDG